jgi:nucleotide-binding universal stress UspA family protein
METTMIDLQRILCPIDFSDCSRRALDHAVAMARWYKATITAVHVDSSIEIASFPAPMVGIPATWKISNQAELLTNLQRFVEAESAPGISIKAVVREGPAVAGILEQAAATGADLIVMGTHGTSGFEHLVLGSVTEKVLRKARCPVLTVPRGQPDAVPAGPVVFKRIVCAVDFSDCSLAALTYALSLAQEADGQLTVVHVLTVSWCPMPCSPTGTSACSPTNGSAKTTHGVASTRPCRQPRQPAAKSNRPSSAASRGAKSSPSPRRNGAI